MIYRGSIIEVRENMLIVMLEDSSFKKVKRFTGLEEGMEIYFEERDIIKERNLSFRRISIVAAALFLLIATSFYGIDLWDTNYKAVALVSIDINPSIELKVNRMNHIIKAVALNEDAKKLPLLALKNKPLDQGLEDLIEMARAEGYIKGTKENYILIASVKLKDGVEDTKLEEAIAKTMEQIEHSSKDAGEQIEVISISSNKETLKEAHKEKISVGKKEVTQSMKSQNDWKKKHDFDKEKYNQLLKEYAKKAKELENKFKENDRFNVIEDLKEETEKRREKVLKEETKRITDLKKELEKAKEKIFKEEMNRKKELEKEQEKQKKESEREFKKNEKDIEKKLKEETKRNEEQKKEQGKWDKELKNRNIKEEEKNRDKEKRGNEKENKQKERNKRN